MFVLTFKNFSSTYRGCGELESFLNFYFTTAAITSAYSFAVFLFTYPFI
jgi:hypothetical protein